MSVLLLVLGILLFIGLVVAHEFGHFIMARRNGVTVEEFGIFFPPRLFKHKTRGGWNFTINLLPLGGFVKMKGEHDSDTEPGSFGAASLAAKSKIMAAGVVMNLIIAALLLMITAWVGMPRLVDNQFTVKSDTKVIKKETLLSYVEPGSPAAKAGLKSTDHLIGAWTKGTADDYCYPYLNGTPHLDTLCPKFAPLQSFTSPESLKKFTHANAGHKVVFLVERSGQKYVTDATLLSDQAVAASQKTSNPKGQLGVVPVTYTLQRSTWSAPVVAVGLMGQFTALTFQGLGHALQGVGSMIAGTVTGNTQARQHGQTVASSQVSGTIGTVFVLKTGSLLGYQFILLVIAVISLTLAIMNILPIPALDGGRLWLTLFTRGLRKKPLSPAREEMINGTGFVFLLLLIALITVVDVRRFF